MEPHDLTIVYSSDTQEWTSYLTECFKRVTLSDGREIHLHLQSLKDLQFPLSPTRISYVRQARAQLVILSPEFLQFLSDNPDSILGRMFEPSRVVAMLCGVEDCDVTAWHRNYLLSYDKWSKVTVPDKDADFVVELVSKMVNMVEEHVTVPPKQPPPPSSSKTQFTLTPRKVRKDNRKVYLLLNDVAPDDQRYEIILKSSSSDPILANFKYRNPFTLQFIVPESCLDASQIMKVEVRVGGVSLGERPLKCETKMAELNRVLFNVNNPLEFMCQVLGVPSTGTEDLDRALTTAFRKTFPATGFGFDLQCEGHANRRAEEECPTLLHFSAYHGLKELTCSLLDCPGATSAAFLRNCRGLNAAELADERGFTDLSNMLDNYMRISEAAELYSYMSSFSDSNVTVFYENLPQTMYDVPPKPVRVPSPNNNSNNNNNNDYLSMMPEGKADEDKCTSNCSAGDTLKNVGYPSCQVELLELLEDFKNEKYSIGEVEILFKHWQQKQSRNSFKEKQEHLKSLRQQYDQINTSIQSRQKKPSAIERLRNLLSKSSKKESKVEVPSKQVTPSLEIPSWSNGNRPVSTISSASSGSSCSSSTDRSSGMSTSDNDSERERRKGPIRFWNEVYELSRITLDSREYENVAKEVLPKTRGTLPPIPISRPLPSIPSESAINFSSPDYIFPDFSPPADKKSTPQFGDYQNVFPGCTDEDYLEMEGNKNSDQVHYQNVSHLDPTKASPSSSLKKIVRHYRRPSDANKKTCDDALKIPDVPPPPPPKRPLPPLPR